MTVLSTKKHPPRLCSSRQKLQALFLIVACAWLWSSTRLLPNELLNPDAALPLKEWLQQGHAHSVSKQKGRQQQCRYEGHCPVGFTCVVHETSPQGGICAPYIFENAPRLSDTHPCIQACMDELQWEDHYQFQSRPVPFAYLAATGNGRPDGCRIAFQRVDQEMDEYVEEKIYREWLKGYSPRRIVRVDPIYNNGNNLTWTALCFNPCQNDADCGRGFVCDQRGGNTCRRNNLYWTPTKDDQHDMVIVSGANALYFRALKNLAASLCFWAPQHKIVVYNLGLDEAQLNEIRSWSNLMDLRWVDGIPNTYSPHVHVSKTYAWKPIAINESLHEYKAIFWMDAGSTFTGPIDPVIHIARQSGTFLVKGQDGDMRLSHPKTYQWFNYSKDTYRTGPHYAGNTQAYVYPSRYVDTIVIPSAACALEDECIAPVGSTLQTHRYDQTVLSILAYQQDLQVPHHTEYVAGGKRQLADNPSEPNFMLVYTARGGEQRYLNMGLCNIAM